MSSFLQRLWTNMMPLVAMLVFVALFIVGIFVFSYLLVIAAILGLVLFIVAFIRSKLTPNKRQVPDNQTSGRIIDHDET